jgi:hypothetical protein
MVEVESQIVPLHTMKACRRSRCIAPLILNLGTDGGEWSAARPQPLYPRPFAENKYLNSPRDSKSGSSSPSPSHYTDFQPVICHITY